MYLPSLVIKSLLLIMLFSNESMAFDEVKNGADIYAPFRHKAFYQGEREQLAYNPKYYPGLITFDEKNIPYVRNINGTIQTLDKNGNWLELDFKPAIKSPFPAWGGDLFKGPSAEERIVFDNTGTAYMTVTISRNTADAQTLLLSSRNHCRSWEVYPLPKSFAGWFVKIENMSPLRRLATPPVLTVFKGSFIYLIIPVKTKSGLKLSKPVLITKDALVTPTHSGGGNFTVTSSGKTFIVYASTISKTGTDGTPQYIAVYDHIKKCLSAPVYMGSNGIGKPDAHNLPCIEIDSKGYLHVILGSHHNPFVYFCSQKPYDISSWTAPEIIGYPRTKMGEGSYTYIGLLCDPFDNLHLVARWAGNGYKNNLIYIKKPAGKSWQKQKKMVEPFKTLYSVYYHKMSQDLRGRIFVNYFYYGNELTKEQAIAYNKKWPEDKIFSIKPKSAPNGYWYNNVKYHDPVVIVSNDSGDSFRLALTEDFVAGQIPNQAELKIINNSIDMPMVKINSGSYMMGSLNGFHDEKPLRAVFLTKSFMLGQYPVRVKDFKKFIAETAYKTEFERIADKEKIYNWCQGKFQPGDNRTWCNPGIKQIPNEPVILITINDAKAFCKWLSTKENAVYRLPTEAEWEYACRAGSISAYYFSNKSKLLARYGWYNVNSTGPMPVGTLLPNAWGLHDMSGNVWEYCADYYIPTRSDLPVKNPRQNKTIYGHVIRGGSWLDDWDGNGNGTNLRSASRYHIPYRLMQADWLGFRVLKEIKQTKK